MIPFSVLDLAPIPVGASAADAFANSRKLAQQAELSGYERFWLAEHHGMHGIASAATAVVIAHVAAGTSRIRVGSGGVMLPNHAPLVIAEQFGTLASLYPGRIDLGLGRAPGSDAATSRALRRNLHADADQFPQDVIELQSYFAHAPSDEREQRGLQPMQRIRAVPGAGLQVPLWLLGSSLFSAQLAAALGLPFAFASHFAPADMLEALALYRSRFRPSEQLAQPYAMLAINVTAADTDREAKRQFSSQQQAFVNLIRGMPGQIPAPVDDIESVWSVAEKAHVERMLSQAVVGSPATVEAGLRSFIAATKPDELMITGHGFDQSARERSLQLVAEVRQRLGSQS